MNPRAVRLLIGIALVPALIAVVWTVPYVGHSAASKWLGINTALAYATFLGLSALCHVVLRIFKLRRAWQYATVMFVVSFFLSLALALYSVRGYHELYHSRTQVVSEGMLTTQGFILYVSGALQSAALLAVGFLLFWFIAVREPRQQNASA